MKKMKLTKAGRAVIFLLVAAIVCVGGWFGYQHFAGDGASLIGNFASDKLGDDKSEGFDIKSPAQNIDVSDSTIKLSLDEWIG